MSEQKQNLYEGMYIISSALTDDARQKALQKVREGITSRGGEVVKEHEMGRRRLAYEINGHKEGYYYLLYFNIKTSAIVELRAEYRLMEDLVRQMILETKEVKEKLEFKALQEV